MLKEMVDGFTTTYRNGIQALQADVLGVLR
jgi:hypothetical protein